MTPAKTITSDKLPSTRAFPFGGNRNLVVRQHSAFRIFQVYMCLPVRRELKLIQLSRPLLSVCAVYMCLPVRRESKPKSLKDNIN